MEKLVVANYKDENMQNGMMALRDMGYYNFILNQNMLTKHKFNLEEVMENMLDGNIAESAFR